MFKQLCFLLLVIGINVSIAQTNWIVKNPFEQKNFIENKGQFDETKLPNKEPILFAAHIDGVNYYFTKTGYAIGRMEQEECTEEEIEKLEKQIPAGRSEEKENKFKYKNVEKFHELKWLNTNAEVEIISENKVTNYYSYSDLKSLDKKGTIIANAYKKIIYKNIYPNTDIIYEFLQDSMGIKYSIYLHPGADVTKIKFTFPDNNKIQLQNDNLEIESVFGKIIDHKPVSFWADDKTIIKSGFNISGSQIGFELEKAIKNKTVVIDPWVVTPNFSGNNDAYDVDYDNQGNTYVYGGADLGPYVLLKYSPTGVLLWSYIPFFTVLGESYGDFAIDKSSNNIYVIQGMNYNGAQVAKINSNGTQLAAFAGNPKFGEMWRVAFSRCTHEVIIAGGGITSSSYQTCHLDSNLTSFSPVQYVPSGNCCHDVILLALDDYGNCYQGTTHPNQNDGLFSNVLVKLPLPTLLPITYSVNTDYKFDEMASNIYYGTMSNGYNGLTTSNTLVYSYDSYVLKKWNGSTGTLLSYNRINYPAGGDSSKVYWGGISADNCGNLFLGDSNIVRQYDASLTLINSYTMPGVIIDVNISSLGTLYVCGLGFVSTLIPTMAPCSGGALTLSASSTNNCNTLGAKVTIMGGSPPYTVVWNTSPPQYGTSISNLLPGTYTVTVTEASCFQQTIIDTVTVFSGSTLPLSSTPTIIKSCPGQTNNGSITITTTGGIAPYTYTWSNGESGTANSIKNLSPGTYSVTITDSAGCTNTHSSLVVGTFNSSFVNAGIDITIYAGLSTQLNASGGGTYSWSPQDGLSCITCSNPIASPLYTTIYTVTVTDTNGCSISDDVVVNIDCGEIFIPNAFSPNSDNENDLECVFGKCIETMEFSIYDRWGEKVFETIDPQLCWDGIYKGKPMDTGVFVYYFNATLITGEKITKKGNISLIR
jgi:gliding motility-associated-like protein